MNKFYGTSLLNGDAFIFIPCHYSNQISNITPYKKRADNEVCICELIKNIVSKEIDNINNISIDRSYVEDVKLEITSDDNDNEVISIIDASLYISSHKNTKTAVVMLEIRKVNFELSLLFDQTACGRLNVLSNNSSSRIDMYLRERFSLIKCGTNRTFTNLYDKPDHSYLKYLLAGEAFKSDLTMNSDLCASDIENAANENIAQFNFSEIYAYDTSLVQIVEYEEELENRLYTECLTIFIIEFLQFQEASVSRVISKVARELDSQNKFSIKKILEINKEFSKSMKFCNINIFHYPSTQKIVNKISDKFEMGMNMSVFNENKNILEHIISTHSVISSERENKILNYIVLVLTLTQVIPIYYSTYMSFMKDRPFQFEISHLIALVIIFALISILKLRAKKKIREF